MSIVGVIVLVLSALGIAVWILGVITSACADLIDKLS
jgi:hypothetical protein